MKRRIAMLLGSVLALGATGAVGAPVAEAINLTQNVAGKQVTVATYSNPNFDYVLVGVATPPSGQDAVVRVDCFGNGSTSALFVTYVVANNAKELGPLGALPTACPALP